MRMMSVVFAKRCTTPAREFGEIERKRVLDIGNIRAMCAASFDGPIVKKNFARGIEEIAGANAFDNRRPAFVIRRDVIEL